MAIKKDKTPGELIAKSIIETYDPKTTEDIQDALKSIFGPIFESMLDGEMEHHLGFSSNSLINTSAYFFCYYVVSIFYILLQEFISLFSIISILVG